MPPSPTRVRRNPGGFRYGSRTAKIAVFELFDQGIAAAGSTGSIVTAEVPVPAGAADSASAVGWAEDASGTTREICPDSTMAKPCRRSCDCSSWKACARVTGQAKLSSAPGCEAKRCRTSASTSRVTASGSKRALAPAGKGTGVGEPMIFTIEYGKGRVFHTPMGHDVEAMRCRGFYELLQRGTEWAATGKVERTAAVPADFPTETAVSVVNPALRPTP